MEQQNQYDVIIVGLGCYGLSAAYYMSKNGMKVLGVEQHPQSGYFGSSSTGATRIWRKVHFEQNSKLTNMMEEALEIWKEAEEKSGKKLLEQTGMLMLLNKDGEQYKDITSKYDGEKLSMVEVRKRWPAMSDLPDSLAGYFDPVAGVVRVRDALEVFKELSIQNGATLIYNAKVETLNKQTGDVQVRLNNEVKAFKGGKVVLTTGVSTNKFFDDPK